MASAALKTIHRIRSAILAVVVLGGVVAGIAYAPSALADSTPTYTLSMAGQFDAREVVLSPDGETGYVLGNGQISDGAGQTGPQLSVVDALTDEVTDTIEIPSHTNDNSVASEHSLAISPDGGEVYIAMPSGTVVVVDTTADSIKATIGSPTSATSSSMSILVSPDGKTAYLSGFPTDPNDLLALDLVTDSVTGRIALGNLSGQTWPAAMSSDGATLYLLNSEGPGLHGSVLEVNTATNSVTRTIAGFTDPSGATLSPDGGTLYVTDTGASYNPQLAVVDLTSSDIVKAISGLTASDGAVPYLSPDGSRVYVVSNNGTGGDSSATGAVTVVDASTDAVTATIPVDDTDGTLAMSPDGQRIYVPASATGWDGGMPTLLRIDAETNAITGAVPTVYSTRNGLVLSPDDATLYVAGLSGVSAIDTGTGSATATFAAGTQPDRLAISPDGKTLYVTDRGDSSVSVIDTATDAITHTISVGAQPSGVALSPAGDRLYVANYADNSVSVISTASESVIATIPVNYDPSNLIFSPDGSTVYVAALADNGINQVVTVINTAAANVIDVISVPNVWGAWGDDSSLAISSDGQNLYDGSPGGLAVINTATDAVVTPGVCGAYVALSPDGKSLYASCRNSIALIDTATNSVGRWFGSTYEGATNAFSGTAALAVAANGIVYGAFSPITVLSPLPSAPRISSEPAATFATNSDDSFKVTTWGNPLPALSEAGALPTGVTFVDNGDGTATISGAPPAGVTGTYPVRITAENGQGIPAAQTFTLTVHEPPSITSAATATLAVGSPGTFSVTASGDKSLWLSENGRLPIGVTFTDNGDGTATLSGTPAADTAGAYPITIIATSDKTWTSDHTSQSFVLVVGDAARITSASFATFTIGKTASFTVSTAGYPATTITESGALPSGLSLSAFGFDEATIWGTPRAGTAGTYPITITASNGEGADSVQSFTVIVNEPPSIASASSGVFTVGSAARLVVEATGTPTAAIRELGPLPGGLRFVDNGDGTATIAGSPAAGTGGTYPITISASNGVSPDAMRSLSIVVNEPSAITSSRTATFTAGQKSTFAVTTTGFPAATVTETGAIPRGLVFKSSGNGSASISGSAWASAAGAYKMTLYATNGAGKRASQTFTLKVDEAPRFTSPTSAVFVFGRKKTFAIRTAGYPSATISATGPLPRGLRFKNNRDGTATISGTPIQKITKRYTVVVRAKNAVGAARTMHLHIRLKT